MRRLASLEVGVVLLTSVLLALATGTVIESMRGPDVALQAVNGAAWLVALEIAAVVVGIMTGSIWAASSWGRTVDWPS